MLFVDRIDAGRRLADRLEHLRDADPVVLGLPRGGVPVAYQVAEVLDAPLDVIVVRKLGVPFQPELGMGAIGEDGVRIINPEVVHVARVTEDDIAEVERRERAELQRRARRFRGERPRVPLEDRTAIVIDDGIATGSTARAACQVARAHGASRVVLAVPVAPQGWTDRLRSDADELIALATPDQFWAIGQWYDDFTQTTDQEVVDCLERRARAAAGAGPDPPTGVPDATDATGATAGFDAEVSIPAGPVTLAGRLTVPDGAAGVVVFAHGSGSSRHSPRNQYVAGVLNEAGLGTLLFDLLTVSEEVDRANVFDIGLLARRLVDATRWLRTRDEAHGLAAGYFGASTGAAAALWAAADLGSDVTAVVSRGGRPDLAGARLGDVVAPTLLIVGGRDEVVLDLNRQAQAQLRCENRLAVVPGATHLFEEPGTLQQAAGLARDWLADRLVPARPPAGR
ncbi:MAG TPA: phosphoribosyltransferase family protein [Acidimicrobiales bacterium]